MRYIIKNIKKFDSVISLIKFKFAQYGVFVKV